MSRLPTVIPWKSPKDILELKDLFYNQNDNLNFDPRVKALAKVKAYQTRTGIPHSIEATSLLTAAILNDIPNNDPYNIRLSYSMAIIRFVNGLLDPSQQSQYALPLHLLAKSLDLPSAFVELRHAATHEALPSLETLRQLSRRGLDWLYHHYWDHNSDNEIAGELNGKKESIKELLREWRRIRRQDPTKTIQPNDTTPDGIKFWKLIKSIESVIEQDEELFIEVLLYKNVLIPTGSDAKKLSSAIKLFSPLFEYLKIDGFNHRLVLSCINLLNNQKTVLDWVATDLRNENESNRQSNFHFSLIEWIKYFLVPTTKSKSSSSSDFDMIIKELLLLPRQWNLEILRYYLENATNSTIITSYNQSKLSALVETMASQIESIDTIKITPQEPASDLKQHHKRVRETDENVETFTKRLKLEKDKLTDSTNNNTIEPTGWSTVPNWTPRPIGVLQ